MFCDVCNTVTSIMIWTFHVQERFSEPGGGGDQISTLQSQVEEVKGVMTQNIERVLERGERLEDLMDKTNDLEASVSYCFRCQVLYYSG